MSQLLKLEELLQRHANMLGEHFNSVLILASTNLPGSGTTSRVEAHAGDECAALGHASIYVEKNLEAARYEVCEVGVELEEDGEDEDEDDEDDTFGTTAVIPEPPKKP